jgi:iron(III) transport system substrate-binding protein
MIRVRSVVVLCKASDDLGLDDEEHRHPGYAMSCWPCCFVLLAIIAALLPTASAAPPPTAVTQQLIDAANQEGKVIFYTSMELQTAEKVGEAFEAAYPGIAVQVERNGCERLVQRLAQERSSKLRVADAIECSDISPLLYWKSQGWLAPFLPVDVADKWPADQRDPDGYFAAERFTLSPIAYNTKLVKPEDAPRSFADLLDKKWTDKIVKARPGYSGTIMTVTFELSRYLGWEYLKKLGQQRVMQVQSGTDPPKKVAQGERPIAADGDEYFTLQIRDQGGPIEPVYPTEGTPSIPSGAGVIVDAPHPNAARLFVSWLFSRDGQQLLVDSTWLRSFDPEVKRRAGMKPLSEINVMKSDPAAQAKVVDEIKNKYDEYFGF